MTKKLLKTEKLFKNRDFWIVISIIILGFYTGFFKNLFIPPKTARLEIDFGDQKRAFEGDITEEMSILDAVLASDRTGGFEFRYAIVNNQTNILKVDGFVNNGLNDKTMNFYLNGEKIDSSEIHRIKIKPGDKILVIFE